MRRPDEMLTIRAKNDPNPFWGIKYRTYKCKYADQNEWCEKTVERLSRRAYYVCGRCKAMKNQGRATILALKVKQKKELALIHSLSTTETCTS